METQRLTSAMLHILLALLAGKRHGYAIIQDVIEMTDGRLKLGPGTLYRTIKQMLVLSWIEEDEEIDDEQTDERRRYYQITKNGRDVLHAELKQMEQIMNFAKQFEPSST